MQLQLQPSNWSVGVFVYYEKTKQKEDGVWQTSSLSLSKDNQSYNINIPHNQALSLFKLARGII
jgi:hypothetical protein